MSWDGTEKARLDSKLHVAVVGAGAFGGWTALALLGRGARVTLFDAWGPGNSRASSGGESRVIRGMYGPDRLYTEWVAYSLEVWQEAMTTPCVAIGGITVENCAARLNPSLVWAHGTDASG